MLAQYLDITDAILSGTAIVETSNYDYCILQIAGNTGAVYDFSSTLESNAWTGVSDGSWVSSIGYTPIVGTDLSNGNLTTTTGGADGLWRFNVVGRYLRFTFNTGSPSGIKALIMLAKIS